MKYLLLVTVCIFSCSVSHSQIYLGSTTEEILKQENLPIEPKLDDDGNKYLAWLDKNKSMVLVYFKDNLACLTIISPSKVSEFNRMAAALNEVAVRLSDNEWRYYLDKTIVRVKIKHFKALDRNAFYYTLSGD